MENNRRTVRLELHLFPAKLQDTHRPGRRKNDSYRDRAHILFIIRRINPEKRGLFLFILKENTMEKIPLYPASSSLTLDLRESLHNIFRILPEGISEFTFANLYLFRHTHHYRIARLPGNIPIILGSDDGSQFFMLPAGLPQTAAMKKLFSTHNTMKCVSEKQKKLLEAMGFRTIEDRDNFDYLYRRQDLSELSGRKFSKKRNLIKAFINSNCYAGKPLLEEHLQEALQVLEEWRKKQDEEGDYKAAREALEKSWELQLCGGIYYVDDKPVAYSLGEELANGTCFVIHFEKAVPGYKGLFQFINQSFAAILPDFYSTINREQDLGNRGLRQAKHSYKPVGYVKKYRAFI